MIKTDNIYQEGVDDLNTYVEAIAYGIFERKLAFREYGEVQTLPRGSSTYQFSIEKDMNIDIDNSKLQEGVSPTEINNEFRSVKVTTEQFGKVVKMSDRMLRQTPIDAVEKSSRQLGEKLARIYDAYIQSKINDGTNVVFGGTATTRGTVTTSDTLTFNIISKVSTLLADEDVPTFGDGAYVTLLSPKQTYDLFGDTATTQIGVNPLARGGSEMAEKEIRTRDMGVYYGVRYIETTNIQKFVGEGAAGVDVYPVYVIGQEAYGIVEEEGIESFAQMPVASSSDPLAQRGFVSGKFSVGADILKQEALYRIEVGSSLDA